MTFAGFAAALLHGSPPPWRFPEVNMRTPIIVATALSLVAFGTPAFARHHHHHKHKAMAKTPGAMSPAPSAGAPSSDMRGPGTAGSSGGSAGPATGTGSGTANPTATGGNPGGNNSKN